MRILLVCPIPIEYNACRAVFQLKDVSTITGARASRGNIENTEIFTMESGPTKARASAETTAAIYQFEPDVVVDTGCCGGVASGSIIGEICIAQTCYEYDISGSGFPRRMIPEMRLPSAFHFLQSKDADELLRGAIESGRFNNYFVKLGIQASGEFIVQSERIKKLLSSIFHATACNWETAGVFIAALKNSLPPLSIRVVSDLADSDALVTFKKNAKKRSLELYQYIETLVRASWFDDFLSRWKSLNPYVIKQLPRTVLP